MSSATEKLEQDVSSERSRIDETLEAIQRRLTPGQLVDEVLRQGRGAGSDFVANLGRTLAANPIPTALVGVGLLWLLLMPKPSAPVDGTTNPATAPGPAAPSAETGVD